MRTTTKNNPALSTRTPRPVKALRVTALVTALVGTLCYPISFILTKMSSPYNPSGMQLEIEQLMLIAEGIPRIGTLIIAIAILLLGIADRIKHHHSHRNTSAPKYLATTIAISTLWLLLIVTSTYVLPFAYSSIRSALW